MVRPYSNHDGRLDVPRVEFSSVSAEMTAFDSLPAAYRTLLRNAPFKLTLLQLLPLTTMREQLRQITRASALQTYGPDHPQSGR